MTRNSFIQISKLTNLKGRIDYITNPKRQENLYAVYDTADEKFWSELGKCNRLEFKKSGSAGKCIESRELIIALPEPFCNMDKKKVLKDFTELFRKSYGVNCIAAMHHNKTKTNLHIHLIFSEREELKNSIEKVATRNMFYDENGKHIRTKKEILDADGKVRKGCSIIKKGEVYEYTRFSKKKAEFKARSFLKGVKILYTEHINSFLQDKDKLQVFSNRDIYLPTKKIGKNNPKAEQIRKNNRARMEWNSIVDEALLYQVPRKHIRTIKEEKILKTVNKFGKMGTKTVGGLKKNKSSLESKSVGVIAEVFEKAVKIAGDCLKGLIRLFKDAIVPKAPMPITEYEQYARNVDRLVENNRNLNKTHMTIKELEEKIERKEYKLLGGRKKLKEEIVQLKKQEKNAKGLEKRLLKALNGANVDDVLSKFNRTRMEMAAYERLADRAEDAKEMLDEEVRSYMKDIKVNIKIQENENRKIR
ncbi:MobA/MobL family protein [Eubacterium sp.]|uniref:MobA/MobL family protein n=1 Tax=Eubacterium sp. TaxID=142586 RepID=UPI0035225061